MEDTVQNEPNFVPGIDVFEEDKLSEGGAKSTSDRNPQVNSKKHKNKKEHKLPRRLSKRLAGHEPELVPAERPLEYATRKSYKDEPFAYVLLNSEASKHLYAGCETGHIVHASNSSKVFVHGEPLNKSNQIRTVPEEQLQKPQAEKIGDQRSSESLNNGASAHLGTSKEIDHSVHASYSSETRVYREPLNESKKRLQRPEVGRVQRSNVNLNNGSHEQEDSVDACDNSETRVRGEPLNNSERSHKAQTVPEEQQQMPEAEKIGDQRSGPQLSLPFGDSWSDPCLEFAIKTLTGALPVEATADVFPVISPSVSDPPNQDLLESVGRSINEEVHDNLKQTIDRKGLNLVWEPSKQYLGQPEISTNSASCENSSNFATREPYFVEAYNITRNLDEGNPVNVEVGNITQLNHNSRNINMYFRHEETAKKIGQILEDHAVPAEQSQLETLNNGNPESHFCAQFMDSWSDPCLEFAFKTLTGAIPLEGNLAIHGPVNCHGRGSGGSTLQDFVSPSFSRSDVSSHHDMGEKSMPGRQPPMSFSVPPWENVSVHNGSGVDSRKPYPHYNKKF